MSACPNCGAIPRPTDKFCNTCGTPVAQAAPGPGASQQGYPAPAPPWGAPPPAAGPARCQLGHDIPQGASYCAQGHPLALDGIQFAGGPGGYAPAPPAYGAPPAPPPGYGAAAGYAPSPAAPPGYAAPPNYGGGYAPAPPAQQGYAPQAFPSGGTPASPAPQAEIATAVPQTLSKVLRAFMVSYQTNAVGDFWPLYTGRHTVGRSNAGEALDVPLADATISSRHAAVTIDATTGSVQVEDMGSTNGTFVNDEHLGFNGRRELKDGDRVRFGGYTTIIKVIARS